MMLKTLLWKDFRQHGKLLVACGALLLIPYVVAVVALTVNQLGPYPVEEWIRFFSAASTANALLAIVLIAFIAGNAIAGERADRSAEFTAYLPIGRKTAILSKVLTALGICVALMGAMWVVKWILTLGDMPASLEMSPGETRLFLSTAIPMFGVAWLFSSFARTPTIAAAMGVAFPVCLGLTCGFLSEFEAMEETDMGTVYMIVGIAVGLLCFAVGVVHYLRRLEP